MNPQVSWFVAKCPIQLNDGGIWGRSPLERFKAVIADKLAVYLVTFAQLAPPTTGTLKDFPLNILEVGNGKFAQAKVLSLGIDVTGCAIEGSL